MTATSNSSPLIQPKCQERRVTTRDYLELEGWALHRSKIAAADLVHLR